MRAPRERFAMASYTYRNPLPWAVKSYNRFWSRTLLICRAGTPTPSSTQASRAAAADVSTASVDLPGAPCYLYHMHGELEGKWNILIHLIYTRSAECLQALAAPSSLRAHARLAVGDIERTHNVSVSCLTALQYSCPISFIFSLRLHTLFSCCL
jgi:hypothetical protein